jgi:hypothetical protein
MGAHGVAWGRMVPHEVWVWGRTYMGPYGHGTAWDRMGPHPAGRMGRMGMAGMGMDLQPTVSPQVLQGPWPLATDHSLLPAAAARSTQHAARYHFM